jgi:hypothetical protein
MCHVADRFAGPVTSWHVRPGGRQRGITSVDPAAVAWAHSTVSADAVEAWRAALVRGRPSVGWFSHSVVEDQQGWHALRGSSLRVLAETGHRLIPEVIVHSRHPRFLIADAGLRLTDRRLSPTELIELWCRVLGEYADHQRSVPVDAVLPAEVPDFRPARMPQWYKGLLDGHECFSELVTSDLTQLERERAKRFLSRLERLAADLGEGPPATVQHDHVHETNALLAAGAQSAGRTWLASCT